MGFWDGSGISWTICKQSAPQSRQITIPTPHHSIFTGRMLILTPNQQCLAAVRTNAVSEKQTQQLPSTDACLQSAALYSVHELARVRRSFWHGEMGRWCRTGVGAAAGTVGLSPASGGCHASCLVGYIRDGILRKREAANWQFAVCSFHCTRDMTRHLSTQLRSGEDWSSASVVNRTIVTDPTIRQPGFHLPHHTWSLMNRYRTGQRPCCANLHKWGLTQSPSYDCGQWQTINHIVDTCPLTKFEGGLNLLHEVDDDAVIWLESQRLQHSQNNNNCAYQSDIMVAGQVAAMLSHQDANTGSTGQRVNSPTGQFADGEVESPTTKLTGRIS